MAWLPFVFLGGYPKFGGGTLSLVRVPSVCLEYLPIGGGTHSFCGSTLSLVEVPSVWLRYPQFGGGTLILVTTY